MLVLEHKEKLFILLSKVVFNIPITKLHWRICEIKMIPVRITSDDEPPGMVGGKHNVQVSTLCGC